ncbi:MAG: HAD family hydrolase [Bdellovibrionales bacterium]
MTSSKKILDEVLAQAEAAARVKKKFMVVFDLDSTLFCVSPRIRSILDQLSADQELLQRFPKSTPTLHGLDVTPTDWGIRTVLIRSQIIGTLDFFEMVRSKWAERFFSSEYLKNDLPYPGAVKYVQRLAALGAEIRYLTGRDWPRMGLGTVASLDQWQFPLASQQHLHMKPDSNRHDADFKLDTLRHLQLESPDIYFFENEPVIINLVHRQLPSLPIIFINSIHSGRESAPDHLPKIDPNFE